MPGAVESLSRSAMRRMLALCFLKPWVSTKIILSWEEGALAAETIEQLSERYGRSYRPLLTAGGMTAAFTMVFTGTIVNVAVPDVMGAYGVGQDKAQLLSTAFAAAG